MVRTFGIHHNEKIAVHVTIHETQGGGDLLGGACLECEETGAEVQELPAVEYTPIGSRAPPPRGAFLARPPKPLDRYLPFVLSFPLVHSARAAYYTIWGPLRPHDM
jgi:hypothetical protein